MKQPQGHDVAIQFFAICATSGVDPGDAVSTAATVNEAAATFGPGADFFWDAVNAALLGEYAHLRSLGIELVGISDALGTISHRRRVEYRLLAIRKHLQPLCGSYRTSPVASALPGAPGGRA